MKKCPYCDEENQDEAIACGYCGRAILKESVRSTPQQTQTPLTIQDNQALQKQDLSTGDVIIAFLIPVIGLIVAVVYLDKEESRSRGFALMATSIIFGIVWGFICSFFGFLLSY